MVVVWKGSRARKLEHGGQVSCRACGDALVGPPSRGSLRPCSLTHAPTASPSNKRSSCGSVAPQSQLLIAAAPVHTFEYSNEPSVERLHSDS